MMSFINAYLSSSEIWLLLGISDLQHELLLWHVCLYIELSHPVVIEDPSGSLSWPSSPAGRCCSLISRFPAGRVCSLVILAFPMEEE